MWEPWTDALYKGRRLLILGESCYSSDQYTPGPDHPIRLVEGQLREPAENLRFTTMLTKALAGTDQPTLEQRKSAWRSAALTNFVPQSLSSGRGVRPNSAMWEQGATEFRPLLEKLKPRNVIALGFDLWRHLPPGDISLNDDIPLGDTGSVQGNYTTVTERVRGYRLPNGIMSRIWCHWHPAGGASWESIRDAIAKAEATPEAPGWEPVG